MLPGKSFFDCADWNDHCGVCRCDLLPCCHVRQWEVQVVLPSLGLPHLRHLSTHTIDWFAVVPDHLKADQVISSCYITSVSEIACTSFIIVSLTICISYGTCLFPRLGDDLKPHYPRLPSTRLGLFSSSIPFPVIVLFAKLIVFAMAREDGMSSAHVDSSRPHLV